MPPHEEVPDAKKGASCDDGGQRQLLEQFAAGLRLEGSESGLTRRRGGNTDTEKQ